MLAVALFLLLAAPAWSASTSGFKDVITPLAEECKVKLGATDAEMDRVVHREELETYSAKCLQQCVYELLGGMKDGRVASKEDALRAYHQIYQEDEDILRDSADKMDLCTKPVMEAAVTDPCEVANIVQQCFRKLH